MDKLPFELLEQGYFDYLYYVRFCGKMITEQKKREWVEKLAQAGWTEEEWDAEFELRYPEKRR
jgi:hypothetical protein